MKPRTVIVTLELETDLPLMALRHKPDWQDSTAAFQRWGHNTTVHQVQASVAQPVKEKKGK